MQLIVDVRKTILTRQTETEKLNTDILPFHSLTHEAEPFLRSRQFCSHSRTSQHFMEPMVHYRVHKSPPLLPIRSQISPVHTIPSYLRSYVLVFPVVSFLQPFPPIPSCIHVIPIRVTCLAYHTLLDLYHSNYTWRRVQVMNLVIM
jgi:hypothetical protein